MKGKSMNFYRILLGVFIFLLLISWSVTTTQAQSTNPTQLTEGTIVDDDPKWSPDGSQIVFIRYAIDNFGDGHIGTDNDNGQVYIINADGSGSTALTQDDKHYFSPKWSPDGTQIAFLGKTSNSWGKVPCWLYVMKPDGSDVIEVTDSDTTVINFDWSPDGSQIVFGTQEAYDRGVVPGNIYLVTLSDGSISQLMEGSGIIWKVAWSPDGTQIAFQEGKTKTRVIDLQGNEITKITDSMSPVWSPDGKRIVWQVVDSRIGAAVLVTDVETGKPIWDQLVPGICVRWNSDGTYLLCRQEDVLLVLTDINTLESKTLAELSGMITTYDWNTANTQVVAAIFNEKDYTQHLFLVDTPMSEAGGG